MFCVRRNRFLCVQEANVNKQNYVHTLLHTYIENKELALGIKSE